MRLEQPKRATVFNGTSSFINCGDICNFSQNFSMSAWINKTSAGHCILASRQNGVITQYGIGVHNNQNLTVYTDSSVGQSSTNLVIGQWYHVCVVYGLAGAYSIYIDGEFDSSHAINPVTLAPSNFIVGRRATAENNWFPGQLFDLQVFNQTLSAPQVAELYSKGSQALRGISRELWLKLDSNTLDSSGNIRHGTPASITHASVPALPFSYQNDAGYTLAGGVLLPRDESARALDVTGGPLQFRGPIPRVTDGTPTPQVNDTGRISVKQFGAVGDGVADDYAAVNLAVTRAAATGKTLYFPDGTYRLSTTIARNVANSNPLTTDLAMEFAPNARLTSQVRFLDLEGAATARTVTADIANNANTITLASAAGIQTGDTIFLESTVVAEYSWDLVARETHLVRSVSGNVVTLYTRIRFAYTVAEVAVCRTRKALTLRLDGYRTLSTGGSSRQENVIHGMRVLSRGMEITTTVTPQLNWGLVIRESIGSRIIRPRINGVRFGVNFDFCGECVVGGLYAVNTFQPQLVNTWSRNCVFRNALAVDGGDVIDGHPSFDTKYENCHAINCLALGSPRGVGVTVLNCTLRTSSPIAQNFFGPPVPNGTGPNGGLNVTRFPWLSTHQITLDGVHLLGPSAQTGFPGIFVGGNGTRVNVTNCTAPGLYIECPASLAAVKVSSSTFGVLWDRHAGTMKTSNVTIDKSLLGFLPYAMRHAFAPLTVHTGLTTVGFDPLVDHLYLNLSNSPGSQYLFANCDIRGFLDWMELKTTSPTVQVVNSIVGITNNATVMPLTKFSNNTGTFGVSL